MGLFDDVKCKYPLPGIGGEMVFQTKDLECYMEKYEITENGRLLHSVCHYEDKSDPNAEPGSIEALAGCMSPVHERWEDLNFHGVLNFYTSRPLPTDHTHIWASEGCHCGLKNVSQAEEWIEFNAKFTDGAIVSLERMATGEVDEVGRE